MIQEDKTLHERTTLLYQNSYAGLLITVIAAAGLVFGLPQQVDSTERHVWFGMMLGLVLLRTFDVARWTFLHRKGKNSTFQDLQHFRLGALATAAMWSVYCLYFYESSGIYELATAMIVVSAMAGGAATVLAGDMLTCILYTQIMLVPYSVRLLMSGHSSFQTLGILGLAFSVAMLSIARRSVLFTRHSVELRHEHELLLKSMEQEVQLRSDRIVELSQMDPLTNLLNRKAFVEAFKSRIAHDSQVRRAVIFIDLDGFKPVNDNFGHKVGDEVLGVIAQRLQCVCSEQDVLCRWGGDEFIILTPIHRQDDVDRMAMAILAAIKAPIHARNHLLQMGASIGIALYPDHGSKVSELVTLADLSMYSRKQDRVREYVVYDHELEHQIKTDLHLGKSMFEAIEKGQFKLVFQPIVDARSERIEAAEALLRWNLEGQSIPPDLFIPIAEKNGSIRDIGYWVLEQVMIKAAQLQAQSRNLKLCVNVSVAQFEDPEFTDTVRLLLEKHGIDARMLHLELTESVFSRDKLQLINSVKILQKLGLMISVDDFGTGYSSLSIIQDLQVNIVKIDRSFVKNLDVNGIEIVRAVMVMARGLGYQVVAEGVERLDQAERLRALGVDLLQGYYYAKPLEFSDLLKRLQ